MAPKRTRKLVHETMVEEPTQDLNVPYEALVRRNKKILKDNKTMRTTMTMKIKRSNQPHSFSLQNNWRFLLEMSMLDFIGLVTAFKGGSSKGV
jgi:hypothetical protein